MRILEKILCFVLVLTILLIPACSGSAKKKQSETGRYQEKDISPPIEGQFSSFVTADDRIICFDFGLRNRYESHDMGETWQESMGPGADTNRYEFVSSLSLLNDDSLVVFIPDEGLRIIMQDGTEQEIIISDIDNAITSGQATTVTLLQVLSDNLVLIDYMIGGMMMQTVRGGAPIGGGSGSQGPDDSGDIPHQPEEQPGSDQNGQRRSGNSEFSSNSQIVDKTLVYDLVTQKVVFELTTENLQAVTSDDSYIYVMDNNGTVSSYSLADGKAAKKTGAKFGTDTIQDGPIAMFMTLGGTRGKTIEFKDGRFYAVYEGSIYVSEDNGKPYIALAAASYSVGMPRCSISSMYISSDGDIIVNVSNLAQPNQPISHLYRYVWDDNAINSQSKTLNIWSLEDNGFVRAAIAELRSRYPDTYIEYDVAIDKDNAVTAADAIKNLNTRLLAGEGPDIILLDGCSVENYLSKGMLLDMSSLIGTGDIYSNLVEPYINDGHLFCLPVQFLMPTLMGSTEDLALVADIDALMDLVVNGNPLPEAGPGSGPFNAIENSERSALYFSDLKELCDILWVASAPEVVKNNQLNILALTKYLEVVRAINDKYLLSEEQAQTGMMGVAFSDGSTVSAITGSLVWYSMQRTNYAAFTLSNLQLLEMMMERSGSELALFPGLTKGAWEPSTVVSISANTKDVELAAEFVEVMLSDSVQQLNYGTGLPVTKGGVAAQISIINARRAEMEMEPFSLDLEIVISQLEVPSMGDTILAEMMWESIEKCCKGQFGVDEAVKEIEQNVKNYLAERA